MAAKDPGVFPVYKNAFQLGAEEGKLNSIADMESFSVSFDNGVEKLDTNGHRRMAERINDSKSINYFSIRKT